MLCRHDPAILTFYVAFLCLGKISSYKNQAQDTTLKNSSKRQRKNEKVSFTELVVHHHIYKEH